ncbi:MAG TPA: hypothetical protein VGG74_11160 [Kofleriaceae bacterium]|jgi:hypothetical protein
MKPGIAGAIVMVLAATCAIGGLTGSSSLLGEREAHAVVGRPLTPMSYAGVARRTTRRAYRAGAYGAYSAAPAGVVTTLPAGCGTASTGGTVIYDCAGSRYQPYYDGPTVVYRPL